MPVWFDGKSINEALFCEEFLQTHKIIFTNGAFFTPEGRVTDELPLRGEIFEELKCCAVSNIPRKISNIVELMKLAALVEDFPPEPDRIHLSNGTLFLDGTFAEGKPENVRNRFPVAYNPNAPKPVLWLQFLDGLLYMAPSAAQAQGYERVSKYPKSTKYGRQNPITEHWNSDEQLVLWRAAWADVANRHLERTGHEERIDHRSHAERALLERPTVHEGVVARAMEKKGIISDRCELNRQIKADNALLRELRGQVKKLAQAVKNTIPALAETMENLRKNLLLFCYQLGYLRKGKERLNASLNTLRPALTQYNQLAKDIRDKTKERRSLLSEKKALSAVHVFWHRELAAKIAALTEDLEELRSEKNLLLASLAYSEEDAADKFPKDIAAMEQSLKRLEEQEQKYSAELDAALNEYAGLREQAQGFDLVQLYETKQSIRPGKEQEAENRAQQVYGEKYSPLLMFDSKKVVFRMLNEDIERQAVRRMMQQAQKGQQTSRKKNEPER